MQTVTAADGTEIAYETHGDGPPVVCSHGTTADRTHWRPLGDRLADDYTVVAVDRRGRGDSGDGDGYDLDREVADLRAVVEAVDGRPAVFGHSFGGLVALAAAPDLAVDRLVLYEPAVLADGPATDDAGATLAERLQERLDAGDRRGVMRLFMEEAGGVPDVERLPWWPEEVAFDRADTVVRENHAVESVSLSETPTVETPTLLLTGERGPPHLKSTVAELDERLPDSRLVEFDGVGHVGTQEAADRVAAELRAFLG